MPSWLPDVLKVLAGFVVGVLTVPFKVVIERWLKLREIRQALYNDLGKQYHVLSGVHDRLRTAEDRETLPWNLSVSWGSLTLVNTTCTSTTQRPIAPPASAWMKPRRSECYSMKSPA